MITMTSVSGGRTSAYLAANYPTDYNIFSLVRIEDEKCKFPDKKLRQVVEDRIQKPFIGTAEDDMILYTILDLEQYLGREIIWVSGKTFEQAIKSKGNFLPNVESRYCTTILKIEPMFYWWHENINEPIEMSIGYRANETDRANKTLSNVNKNGLLEFKATFEKNKRGQNKWQFVEWQKPRFYLIEDNIYKIDINNFWSDKNVRFANYNNCCGCYWREPLFLKYQFQEHPNKMNWFKNQEIKTGNRFKKDWTYSQIERLLQQETLFPSDFSGCDSGACEMY